LFRKQMNKLFSLIKLNIPLLQFLTLILNRHLKDFPFISLGSWSDILININRKRASRTFFSYLVCYYVKLFIFTKCTCDLLCLYTHNVYSVYIPKIIKKQAWIYIFLAISRFNTKNKNFVCSKSKIFIHFSPKSSDPIGM